METLKANAKSLEDLDDQLKEESERMLNTVTGLKNATAAKTDGGKE
jgi:hypothetical protein